MIWRRRKKVRTLSLFDDVITDLRIEFVHLAHFDLVLADQRLDFDERVGHVGKERSQLLRPPTSTR